MRLRLGLRRLRRALRVPAVSTSAIALAAASLVASAAYVVRRLVHLRHQRRVPGRRAGLAHRHVRRAGAVRLGHGLLRLWRPLCVTALASAVAAAAIAAAAIAAATVAAAAVTAPTLSIAALAATLTTATIAVAAPALAATPATSTTAHVS